MSTGTQLPAAYYAWGAGLAPPDGAGGRMAACYHGLVLALTCAVIYANLPIYGYTLHAGLLPKFFFFATFLLIAPLLLLKHHALAAYLLSPFALWTGLFLLVNLVHLGAYPDSGQVAGAWFIDTGAEARRAAILIRIQYAVFALALGFAVHASASASWLRALALLALLVPCAVLLDFFLPGRLYAVGTAGTVLGRAAAMYINPNMAGEAILLVFLLACAVTPARWRGPLFLLAGAAILTTFSRAAILAWLLVCAILVCSKTLPRSALALTVLSIGVAIAGVGVFESYLLSRSDFDGAAGNIVARLDFFSNFSFGDDSAGERADVLKAGWELFLQNPVFGAGAGATQFWSHRGGTHNQLLLLACEYGMFGIALWAWLAAILLRARFFGDRGLQAAVAFLFVFMSMFTHQMFDSATYWFATFALVSARGTAGQVGVAAAAGRSAWRGNSPAAVRLPFAWSYAALGPSVMRERATV
jgi:hypothetical protein